MHFSYRKKTNFYFLSMGNNDIMNMINQIQQQVSIFSSEIKIQGQILIQLFLVEMETCLLESE